MECLAKELAIFAPGLKVLLVEPGYFRTRAFNNINRVAPRVEVYSQFNAGAYNDLCLASHIENIPGLWQQIELSGIANAWYCYLLTKAQASRRSNRAS